MFTTIIIILHYSWCVYSSRKCTLSGLLPTIFCITHRYCTVHLYTQGCKVHGLENHGYNQCYIHMCIIINEIYNNYILSLRHQCTHDNISLYAWNKHVEYFSLGVEQGPEMVNMQQPPSVDWRGRGVGTSSQGTCTCRYVLGMSFQALVDK